MDAGVLLFLLVVLGTPVNALECSGNVVSVNGFYELSQACPDSQYWDEPRTRTSIPSEIGQMTSLTSLRLDGVTGYSVPHELFNLTNLQVLGLEARGDSSPLFEEVRLTRLVELKDMRFNSFRVEQWVDVEKATNLRHLEIENNVIQSLPLSIFLLTDLTAFYVKRNKLTSLPSEIGALSNLREIGLIDLNLERIPDQIGALEHVHTIHISGNPQMKDLPAAFHRVGIKQTAITEMDLSSNGFVQVPLQLFNMTNIQSLRLDNNRLTRFPSPLSPTWFKLTFLNCSNNTIHAISEELFQQSPFLETVDLSANQLENVTLVNPETTVSRHLRLDRNRIRQLNSVPSDLVSINLTHNELTRIPEALAQLSNLSIVDLSNNLLSSIPSTTLGDWTTTVRLLNLTNNTLTSFPLRLAEDLTSLEELYLNMNNITEFLTNNVTKQIFPQLQVMEASWNELSAFPPLLDTISKATSFQFAGNNIGVIPEDMNWTSSGSLTTLNLANNSLTQIPMSLRKSYLQTLNLRGNRFVSFANVIPMLPPQLNRLDLGGNRISDATVTFQDTVPLLSELFLDSNRLIYDSFTNETFEKMSELTMLELSYNQLTAVPKLPKYFFGGKLQLLLRGNPFVCDVHTFQKWVDPLRATESVKIPNSDQVVCDNVNELGGFPVERLNFGDDEPEFFPTHFVAVPEAGNSTMIPLGWEFPTNGLIGAVLEEEFDCSDIRKDRPRKELMFQIEYNEITAPAIERKQLCTFGQYASVNNLKPYTEYSWTVRPIRLFWDSEGNVVNLGVGIRSVTVRARTQQDLPGPISNISFIHHKAEEDRLVFTWDSPAARNGVIESYQVQYSRSIDFAVSETAESVVREIVLSGLPANTTYWFRVRAKTGAGLGLEWSSPISGSTIPVCPHGFIRTLVPYTCQCESPKIHRGVDCSQSYHGLESLKLKPGYWRIGPESVDIRPCPNPAFCRPENATSMNYCSPQHDGILCTGCEAGYALRDGNCVFCSDTEIARAQGFVAMWFIVLLLVIAIPCFYLIWASKLPKEKSKKNSCACKCCCAVNLRFPDEARMGRLAVQLRTLIGFYQVYNQFVQTMGSLEHDTVETAESFSIFTSLNLSVLYSAVELGCTVREVFFNRLLIYTIYPLCMVGLLLFVLAIISRFPNRFDPGKAQMDTVWIILQIAFLIYPGVSAEILRTFIYDEMPRFHEDPNPYIALKSDYTVDYNSELSRHYRIYAGLMILVYPIGVLVLFMWAVYYDRHGQNPWIVKGTAFLPKPYRFAYFECVELAKKFLLTSAFILIHQASPNAGLLYFLLLCMVYNEFIERFQPHHRRRDLFFSKFSSFNLIALVLAAIGQGLMIFNAETVRILTITVAVFEACVYLYIVAWQIRNYWENKRASVEKQQHHHGSSEDTESTNQVGETIMIDDCSESNDEVKQDQIGLEHKPPKQESLPESAAKQQSTRHGQTDVTFASDSDNMNGTSLAVT